MKSRFTAVHKQPCIWCLYIDAIMCVNAAIHIDSNMMDALDSVQFDKNQLIQSVWCFANALENAPQPNVFARCFFLSLSLFCALLLTNLCVHTMINSSGLNVLSLCVRNGMNIFMKNTIFQRCFWFFFVALAIFFLPFFLSLSLSYQFLFIVRWTSLSRFEAKISYGPRYYWFNALRIVEYT